MAVRNPPSFLQNITLVASGHTAQNDRLTIGAAFAPGLVALSGRSGILPAPVGGNGEVSVLSNTLVRTKPFRAAIQGSRSTLQGQYLVLNDADVDLTIGGQTAGVSRKDLLIVNVRDSAFTPDTLDSAALQVVAGTPAASNPAEPTLGGVNLGNYLILGVLNVPATGSSVTFTPRTDLSTVAAGGIIPALATDVAVPSHDGQVRAHPTLGLQRGTAGAWAQVDPVGMAKACLYATATGGVSGAASWVAVTLDGETIDTHAGHAPGAAGYTVPAGQGGLWMVSGGVYHTGLGAGATLAVAVQVNGARTLTSGGTYIGSIPAPTSGYLNVESKLLTLAAGDVVTIAANGSTVWQPTVVTANGHASQLNLLRVA